MSDRFQHIRILEAMLFASSEPLSSGELSNRLPDITDLDSLLEELAALYANRGINLVRVGERWAFRTAADLTSHMTMEKEVTRKLSRAAVETLAIVAYHQPATRAEIEEIRGVALSRGTLDTLLEAGWIRPKGRRRTPGKPVTWGTTDGFLDHFGLESLDALPGHEELKAAGLLDTRPAIAALGARGLLPGPNEEAAEEEDELDEEQASEILRAEFGADLETSEAEPEPELEDDETVDDDAADDEPPIDEEPLDDSIADISRPETGEGPPDQPVAEVHQIKSGR